jgi:hypothetical protein
MVPAELVMTSAVFKRTRKEDASHSIIDYAYFDGLGRTMQPCLAFKAQHRGSLTP